jgi:hypothetical protein
VIIERQAVAESASHNQRQLATVAELAKRYRMPKTSMYDFLREHPEAGVVRIGRRILVDIDEFDGYVRVSKQ